MWRRPGWWASLAFTLIALAPGFSLSARAQGTAAVWQRVDDATAAQAATAGSFVEPLVAAHFQLDREAADALLQQVPLEGFGMPQGTVVLVPAPDGTVSRFQILESPVMEPELAAKFPDIRTYVGKGLDDTSATARLGWSPFGFYAQVISPKGSYFVEPRFKGNNTLHAAYYARARGFSGQGFTCHTVGDAFAARQMLPDIANRSGQTLRRYRVAVSTTGEFTAFHGGTVAGGLNAVVQIINRLNGIYEVEVSARMVLVANNDLLIFTNAATDPFTNANAGALLDQNPGVLDSIIGPANYDVGHVLATDFAPNGVAYLRAVCSPFVIPGIGSLKGGGVTLAPTPAPDGSWVMVAAHEFGHQFGANHTFNGANGGCGPNRNPTTAFEPGSGSTIMSYSSICGPDNLKGNEMMDPYFHSISFDEITAHLTGAGGTCAVNIGTGNQPPTVVAGPSYTIPRGTPFRLTASGSDPDGDPVTFTWEQRDLGPQAALATVDQGTIPLFRSFPGTSTPTRIFPRLDSLATGVPSVGEQLPQTARTLNFRVTARDNRAAGGGVNTADTTVIVATNSGPFIVTGPGASTNFTSTMDVTWNVAGTTNAPVNAQLVNIFLSVDGGLTFPVVLARDTANDGTETVTLPPINTTQGRVMVEASGNAFFNISRTNFTLSTVNSADVGISIDASAIAFIATNFTYNLVLTNNGAANAAAMTVTHPLPGTVTYVGASNSAGTVTFSGGVVTFTVETLAVGQTVTLPVTVIPTNAATLALTATVSSVSADANPVNNSAAVNVDVFSPIPTILIGSGRLVGEGFSPANGAIDPGETVAVELSVSVFGPGTTTNLVGSLLLGNGVVATGSPRNFGAFSSGSGPVSRVFTFTATTTNTGTISPRLALTDGSTGHGILTYNFASATTVSGTNAGVIVINSSGAATPYPSTIAIGGVTGTVSRVTAQLTKFQHTFPDDVDVLLVGPEGQRLLLLSDVGGSSTANLPVNLIFDDSAASSLPNNGPLSSGTFRPTDFETGDVLAAPAPAGPYGTSFSTFNGSNPNGTWSLFVADDSTGDAGQIEGGWGLTVTTLNILNAPGDLALGASASRASLPLGQSLQYALSVTNVGPSTANGASIVVQLPTNALVIATNLSQGSCVNVSNQLTCFFGNLTTGGVASVILTVVPGNVGTFTNRISAVAARTELTPANNETTLLATVTPAAPQLAADAFVLTAESLVPATGGLEAGETVTMQLALRNNGTANTTNLVATLLATGGVSAPSGAQNYGVVEAGGVPVGRPFTFTVNAVPGAVLQATLALQDGAANLGTVTFNIPIGQPEIFSQTNAITINPFGKATPYPSTLTIAGATGIVSKVAVTLNGFSHGFPDDVDVLLVSPDGQRVMLLSDVGGNADATNLVITISSDAANGAPDSVALTSGTYLPTDFEPGDAFDAPAPAGPYGTSLSTFTGINPNGTWSLYIMDDLNGDGGVVINGWQLVLTLAKPLTPVADLALTGFVTPTTVVAGSNLNYTITVSNRGPDLANSVLLTNAAPAGAQILAAAVSQGRVQPVGNVLVADLGDIAANQSATLTFTVVPTSSGAVTNSAGVTSGAADLLPANNLLVLVTGVTAPAPPELASPTPLGNGQFQFTLIGQNGVAYVIEASTNLVDWQVISTNVPFGSQLIFTDPAATLNSLRMYRARQRDP